MDFFQKVIIEPSERLLESILQFLPNFFSALLILFLGILLGKVLKSVFARLFRAVGLDRFFERTGTAELMKKRGLKDPASVVLSKLVGWITVFIFAVAAMKTLEVPAVERILESFILYLPNFFVSLLILFLGYMLSNFFARAALIASVNAGLRMSGLIGKTVKFTVLVLAGTMALEQLGIGRETIVISFTILFGGVVLALSLALGLGGKDIAREFLEKKLRGEDKKDEFEHL
ncbi:MAG: hypothetical protein OEW04_03750 [Nitrospirota bacterium]|nr:hypothetical protein [Nitrospirota bacterium]